jgi:hypothetical protein
MMDGDAGTVFLDTLGGGGITFPAPQVVQLPPMVITAEPPANQGNQKVVIGSLAIVLMVLAWVGLKSHGE